MCKVTIEDYMDESIIRYIYKNWRFFMKIFIQMPKRSVLTSSYSYPNTEMSTRRRSDLFDSSNSFVFNNDFQRTRSENLHLFDGFRYPLQLPPQINVLYLHCNVSKHIYRTIWFANSLIGSTSTNVYESNGW